MIIVIAVGALAIGLCTWFGAPTLSAIIVGLAIGLVSPARAARTAAAAGLVAWGGLLLVAQLRGGAVATLGATLGAAMGLPGWSVFIATLLYPTVLAASAASLAALVSPRRSPSIHPGATMNLGATSRVENLHT